MMRILLFNLGMESTQEVKQALSDQGYEIIDRPQARRLMKFSLFPRRS